MNAREFLESQEFNYLVIQGDYYAISRHDDGEWMVYSHISVGLPSFEFEDFTSAINAYMKMEKEQRKMAIEP